MQHEGHLALAVVQRILLFMVSLLVIISVLWKAQGAEGSARSIYTAVLGMRSKTTKHIIHSYYYTTKLFAACLPVDVISRGSSFLKVITPLSILWLQQQKCMVGLRNYTS